MEIKTTIELTEKELDTISATVDLFEDILNRLNLDKFVINNKYGEWVADAGRMWGTFWTLNNFIRFNDNAGTFFIEEEERGDE